MDEKSGLQVNPNLQEAIEKFEKAFHRRSFSGRHPELGRMFKCAVCGHRHRAAQVCVQVFAKDEDGADRIAPVQRFRPRVNPYGWRPGRDLLLRAMLFQE